MIKNLLSKISVYATSSSVAQPISYLTYYEAIFVFSKTRILEECTVLRMLGL